MFINDCLWLLRSSAHWRDLPERYSKWKTVHERFSRWCHAGICQRLFWKGRPETPFWLARPMTAMLYARSLPPWEPRPFSPPTGRARSSSRITRSPVNIEIVSNAEVGPRPADPSPCSSLRSSSRSASRSAPSIAASPLRRASSQAPARA
ncbi:transposase [Shinella kummerowiae]|uniref:Transposase n=1 Tax=Shinella kummerowiae TaxID=417745 RepID=A0A6N8SIY6_9HYPH|nr:transposase [Shinella kummerowiae]